MAMYRDSFPDGNADFFIAYVGMETDLMFNRGVDLPGFASSPLSETPEGRSLLQEYLKGMIALGKDSGTGVILEIPTWVAHRDRGAALGYAPEDLKRLTQPPSP